MKACEVIVAEREKQLKECQEELSEHLKKARKEEIKIGPTGEESLFQEYVRVTYTEGVGDVDATDSIKRLFEKANIQKAHGGVTNQTAGGASRPKAKGKGKADHLDEEQQNARWQHREHTHEIRRITKELVGRVRSLRFFRIVRDLQRQNEVPPVVKCPGCGQKNVPLKEIAVLSSCGHTGCKDCVMNSAGNDHCVYADCKAPARSLNVVMGETLGVDDVERDGRGRHFGKKLEQIIDLIKYVYVLFPRASLHSNTVVLGDVCLKTSACSYSCSSQI